MLVGQSCPGYRYDYGMSAPPCEVRELSWFGFPALSAGNGLVRAVVVPTLGARIVSLVHMTPTGEREWLWKNPFLEPQLPDFAAPYSSEFDLGGWDECFPSVAQTHYPTGPWEGSQVPDHGELWCQPWKEKVFVSAEEIELRTVTYGVRFPYRFERIIWIRQGEPKIHISYSVNNLTIFPIPFVWSPHPTFDVRPGMFLAIPAQEMSVYYSSEGRFGNLGTRQKWPTLQSIDDHYFDVSIFPQKDSAIAVKLYGRSPANGLISLKDPFHNSELSIKYDPNEVTHLSVWLNFGGWCGLQRKDKTNYFNLSVAPCIGASDDLALAVNHFREFGLIQPKNLKTWKLELGFH